MPISPDHRNADRQLHLAAGDERIFQSSITAWTDCCEYIGRERLLEILSETNDCIRQGNAERAVELFAGCIEQFKAHLNDAY